jgi:ATP-dependent Zn protease
VEFGLGRRRPQRRPLSLAVIDGDVAAAHREAVRLVRRHWDAIERVADALVERGELTGDEVDALIGWPF